MAQVFGPDTFTVGADTNIDAYPAASPNNDYSYNLGSGANLVANAVNDRVQWDGGAGGAAARLVDGAAPSGTQETIFDATSILTDYGAGVGTRFIPMAHGITMLGI